MPTRRQFLLACCSLPALMYLPGFSLAASEIATLKEGYAQRLKRILAAGELPYIDIESSCNSGKLDIDDLARRMDRLNIGLMALSADIGPGQFKKGVRFDDLSGRLLAAYPDRFIPVGNGGQPPALTEAPEAFLDAQEAAIQARRMVLNSATTRHLVRPRAATWTGMSMSP